MKAVLRGLPQIPSTDEVRHNVVGVRFEIISVARIHMKIEGNKIDTPLNLIQLLKAAENRKIQNLTKLRHMLIKVKP